MNGYVRNFLIITAVLLLVCVLRDWLVKGAVVAAAKQVAGVEVTIDQFSMSLIAQSVHIRGFKAYNPDGFVKEVMLDVPELAVDLDVPALFKGVLHLKYLRLDLKELVVIRNAAGKTNVNSLQTAGSATDAGGKTRPAADAVKASKPADVKISMDLVSLNLGRVVMKEMRNAGEPSVRSIELNVHNKEFRNVTSASELAGLVMVEALTITPFGHGVVKMKGLSADVVSGLLQGVTGVLK